jgi:hypothetical protein
MADNTPRFRFNFSSANREESAAEVSTPLSRGGVARRSRPQGRPSPPSTRRAQRRVRQDGSCRACGHAEKPEASPVRAHLAERRAGLSRATRRNSLARTGRRFPIPTVPSYCKLFCVAIPIASARLPALLERAVHRLAQTVWAYALSLVRCSECCR